MNDFGINPLYCVSLPGCTWQCGLKYTGINLQTLQDKDMFLLLENNIRGGVSSVMEDRAVKSDDNKKILYIDANSLYGHSMSHLMMKLSLIRIVIEDLSNTLDDSDTGYIIEVDIKYPDKIKEKTKNFTFFLKVKKLFLIISLHI